jgi:septum formation protein
MKIILGSASQARHNILKRMGYEFEVMSADIDEKTFRDPDPRKLTIVLAHAKADALLPKITEPALLITSDQVVWCQNQIWEKPVDADEARKFLSGYDYCEASTVTAIVVASTVSGRRVQGVDVAKAVFRPIPTELIDALIADGRVFSWSGAFSIEDPMLKPYVLHITGEKESIEGLPMALTRSLLAEAAL